MATDNPTRNCLVCNTPFVVKTRNHTHAKYCSKVCQRLAGRRQAIGGKVEKVCEYCCKQFSHYPTKGAGKFCCRACKHAAWQKPSEDRGFDNLLDKEYDRLTVIEYAGKKYGTHHCWRVRCSCPEKTEFVVAAHSLKAGSTRSCGCIAKGIGVAKPDTKLCNRCHQEFPYDEQHFVKKGRFRWGLMPVCQTCWAPIKKARHLAWRRRLKVEVLSHYSGGGKPCCTCCGVDHIEFLTLDHVNSDGKEDRKKRGAGSTFYSLLKQQGYPNDPPLQTLCFNCNAARWWFETCPHKRDS